MTAAAPSPWPALPAVPPGPVLVFAPEPAGWLAPMRAQLADSAVVWAPWARSRAPARWWPGPVARALGRRTATGVRGLPGGAAVDVLLARIAADRPTVQYPVAWHRRAALAHVAARRVSRRPWAAVIGPTGAGPLFAAARDGGARTILVHDWPDLAALHADLDAAAGRHPADPWLRRFRPPAGWIAAQRRERHLADHILVRGAFAAARVRADGVPAARLCAPPSPTAVPRVGQGTRVLLAGRGTARTGAYEAVELLERDPRLRMVGAAGTAAVPALRDHARFDVVATPPWSTVAAVLAPAWVESHPAEVAAAAARGLPVIATDRVGASPADGVVVVAPGDVSMMQAALHGALAPAGGRAHPRS